MTLRYAGLSAAEMISYSAHANIDCNELLKGLKVAKTSFSRVAVALLDYVRFDVAAFKDLLRLGRRRLGNDFGAELLMEVRT